MATKFYSKYKNEEIEEILVTSDTAPFYRYYDQAAKLYRFFRNKERCEAWVDAYTKGELTPEIAAYEFCEGITAPAPYTINVGALQDNQYILNGTQNVNLGYTFQTVDGNGGSVNESVEVFYTFKSETGNRTKSEIYNAGATVSMNIDDYLELGTNVITILIKGRSTSATKTVVVTYYVVELDVSSTFDIARSIQPSTNFGVTYTVVGQADKTVSFYIDGVLKNTASVSSLESTATRTQVFNNSEGTITPGKHTLQIQASMMAGNSMFYSKILYYEFIVAGVAADGKTERTVISEVFPNTSSIIVGELPGFTGEQYVVKTINWAYFSSNPLLQTTTVTWRLKGTDGTETTLASRNADVVEAETDKAPEPISFRPDQIGTYNLEALVGGNVIETYTISVIANTAGIVETTEGMTLKLSSLGRDNSEPSSTRDSWEFPSSIDAKTYKATFSNMPWNGNAGWNNDSLWLNNGATAVVDIKPFAQELSIQTNNGAAFEIEFETFNVDSTSAELVRIGSNGGASIVITANEAYIRSRMGTVLKTKFKDNERVKLAFVVHPNSPEHTSLPLLMAIHNNGVRERVKNYDLADTFHMGSNASSSTEGMIFLGNASSQAGIKIYSIRCYNMGISMLQEFYNFIIDSGDNMNRKVAQNDIYITGTRNISAEKCESLGDVIYIDGDIDVLAQTSSKTSISAKMKRRCSSDPTRNFDCDLAQLSNAGQSTLGMPVPSMHVKLDKNNNVTYDYDGKVIEKNYYSIRKGGIPEKKFRLQANYMDSSGCHNGSFLRMINEVFPKVQLNGEYVLRTPPQKYALTQWPSAMGTVFPYDIELTPDSTPCVVFWRKNEGDRYQLLGQYVIMEEKKATRTCGQRSIYDCADDPFLLYTKKGDHVRLWDNSECMQFEVLRNSHDLVMFTDDSSWNTKRSDGSWEREQAYEMIYPDPDDVIADGDDPQTYWTKFYNGFLHPITQTYNNHTAFNTTAKSVLDIYFTAAYYCLMLRHACVDNSVRNIEWTTFDGTHWFPKFWDVDIQFGLRNDGPLIFDPCIDRTSRDPDNPSTYAFAGKDSSGNSCWFWDAWEADTEFMALVNDIDHALYLAGWRYDSLQKMQDEEYVDKWCEQLYNESGDTKYVQQYLKGNDYLAMLQGSRTSHRHYFMRTSFDYWDAKHCCGEYTAKIMYLRAGGATSGKKMHFTAGSTTYFGWGLTSSIQETGKYVEKGSNFDFTINVAGELGVNDPVEIFAANKIEKADFSEIAMHLSSALQFDGCYDSITGTLLKELNVGISKTNMASGVINSQTNISFTGLDNLNRLETFNIQGLSGLTSIGISKLQSLKNFYAAGSGIVAFNPGDGASLENVELPLSIASMTMNGVILTNSENKSAITWWNKNVKSSVPTGLTYLKLTGMGNDKGTWLMLKEWIKMMRDNNVNYSNYQFTYTGINWTSDDTTLLPSVEDLLTLAKIPAAQRTMNGYIKCSDEFTSDQMNQLMAAYGSNIFSLDNTLVIDCSASRIIISATGESTTVDSEGVVEVVQGTNAQLKAVGFPLVGIPSYEWYVYIDGYPVGSEGDDDITFDHSSLGFISGLFKTEESSDADKTYKIACINSSTLASGEIYVRVKARTYPNVGTVSINRSTATTVVVDGVTQILSVGKIYLDAVHKRLVSGVDAGYNGQFASTNGSTWSLEGLESANGGFVIVEYPEGKNANNYNCLQISNIPEGETNIVVKYKSRWKNGLELTAQSLTMCMVKMIAQLLTSSPVGGNPALFAVFDQAGVEHESDNAFSSVEVKAINGYYDFADLLVASGLEASSLTNFTSNGRDILTYLKSLKGFNLSGCSAIPTTLNVTSCSALESVDTTETPVEDIVGLVDKTSLEEVAYNTPKKVKILRCSNVSFDNADRPTSDNGAKVKSIAKANPYYIDTSILSDDYDYYEWIASDGTAHIAIGKTATSYTGAWLRAICGNTTNDKHLIASSVFNTAKRFGLCGCNSSVFTGMYGTKDSGTMRVYSIAADTEIIHVFKLNYLNSGNYSIDDVERTLISATFTGETSELYAFYGHNANTAGTIYQLKISEDSEIVMNLIPAVRKSDDVKGLYDIVNGDFYYSDTQSAFAVGGEFVEYTYETKTVSVKTDSVNIYDATSLETIELEDSESSDVLKMMSIISEIQNN